MMCLQDREEATLELSLFAEAFQEMLARDYGERILKALYAERCAYPCSSCSQPLSFPAHFLRSRAAQ